jgi:O-antigen ligase
MASPESWPAGAVARLKLPADTTYRVLAVAAMSAWGAVLVVALFTANKLVSVPLVVASLLPLALYLSRNPRLVFLLGMVVTAPFALAISFMREVHPGGALSLSIDLMDFFLAALIAFIVRDFFVGRRHSLRLSRISAWWLGLTFLGVLAAITGPYSTLSWFEVVRMLKCWLLFVVIINECVRERHFVHVVTALAFGVAINIVIAAAQHTIKGTLGLEALGEPDAESLEFASWAVYLEDDTVFRVAGLMGHPTLLAAYLAMTLPIFLGQLFTDGHWRYKLFFAIVSAGGVICLVFTQARSAWLSFAVAFLCLMVAMFVLPGLRRRYIVLKAATVVTLLVGLAFAAGPIYRRLTASDPGSYDFRLEWMEIAWRMVQAKPILGFGLNTFNLQEAPFTGQSAEQLYERFGDVLPVVHNIYLLVWAEQGTLGMLLFAGLLVNLFAKAIGNLRYRLSQRVLMISLGALCGLVAICMDGLASYYLRTPAPDRVFWIVVALVVAIWYWNRLNAVARASAPSRRMLDAGPDPSGRQGHPRIPIHRVPAQADDARRRQADPGPDHAAVRGAGPP